MTTDRFDEPTYLIRKQVLKLFGGVFRVYNPQGQLVLFADMKAFKLREDIRLYADEQKQTEVLLIKARQIIDISAAHDVTDAATGQKIGVLKRRGLKSIFRDEWIIMDADEREIGVIREDSVLLALLRRFATNLIPQRFHVEIGPTQVCTFRQNFNPFVLKLTVDFSQDRSRVLDRRLGLAAGVLLCAIEGRQS